MTRKRKTGPKLGELLEKRGRIDRDELFRALRHQRAHGGRFATCLLELELVEEEELLHLLSVQANLPFVEIDTMRSIPDATIALVPAKVARSRMAIPLRASASSLDVAMADPDDIAAHDELAFVSSRRIRPQVASEVRIFEALARYYSEEIPSRYVQLLDRLNRARYLWQREEHEEAAEPPIEAPARVALPVPPLASAETPAPPSPTPRADPVAAAPAAAPDLPPTPPPVVSELAGGAAAAPGLQAASEATATDSGSVPPAEPTSPETETETPVQTLTLEAAEKRLREPTGRNAVGEVLLEFAAEHADAAFLLIVRRNEAVGWLRHPLGGSDQPFDEFRLPLTEPSLVLVLREGVPYYRGPLPPLKSHSAIADLLGPAAQGELLALPLRVRGRLVAALIAASAPAAFSNDSVEKIRHVSEMASVAFELLVLRQKLQHT
jgi:hypothetical protein